MQRYFNVNFNAWAWARGESVFTVLFTGGSVKTSKLAICRGFLRGTYASRKMDKARSAKLPFRMTAKAEKMEISCISDAEFALFLRFSPHDRKQRVMKCHISPLQYWYVLYPNLENVSCFYLIVGLKKKSQAH